MLRDNACLDDPVSEGCADGKFTQFGSLNSETLDDKGLEKTSLNKTCESMSNTKDGYTKNVFKLFCDKCELTVGRVCPVLEHGDHKLVHPNNNIMANNITSLMQEFYNIQTTLYNKIYNLGLTLDRNNQQIEEIKETIEATTLQLKMLISGHEQTRSSCLDDQFSHVSLTTQKTDLQSAMEDVDQSIEITREMLPKHVMTPCVDWLSKEYANHDDDSGICDDDEDLNKKLVPDSFNYVMSLEAGQLEDPVGVTTNQDGSRVFVADYTNDRIQVFDSITGQYIRTMNYVSTHTDRRTTFLCPTGLATDKTGNIVLAERGRHRVTVMTYDGHLKHKFGKMGKAYSQLRGPHGVSVDKRGRIIVADTSNSRIQVFDKDGDFIFTFGQKGEERLDYPTYAIFHKGLFFVSDTDDDTVKVYDKDGHYLRRLTCHTEGLFSAPSGLAIYQDDYILVCDYNNDCIKMFSLQGKFITKFGSAGSGPGQFSGPESVAVSRDHKIIVTDKNNGRVQIFE